jgi:methionine-rich copper-binding protein CopC
MNRLRTAIFGIVAAGALVASVSARAQDLKVVETYPKAQAAMDGKSEDFFVRFDKPVDHIHSLLFVKRGGRLVETLHPRFKTEPNVLFARAPSLAPGDYALCWSVKTLQGADVTEGEIAFSIKAQ